MIAFDRRLSVVQQTMVWQRDADGNWERHLIRQLKNGTLYWSPLIHVLPELPLCLACLSHRVMVHEMRDDDSMLTCHDCGVRYGFV